MVAHVMFFCWITINASYDMYLFIWLYNELVFMLAVVTFLCDAHTVWSDTPARGVVYGSHEHRHVPAAVRGESKLPDSEG